VNRWFVLAIAAVPVFLTTLRESPPPGLVWWTTHALEKIRPFDRELDESQRVASISAARNEFEPFQVVLRAESQDLTGLDVAVSDFERSDGAILSRNNVSIYFERYLDLKLPSSIEGRPGEWPDPLIPRVDNYAHEKRNAFPFKLESGRNQPIWIEVYVPRSALPGLYRGNVEISIGGERQITVPVRLRVWDFALPSTSSLKTTFGFNGLSALRQHLGKYTNDTDLYRFTYLYRKAALWHRISLHGGSMAPPGVNFSGDNAHIHWEQHDREVGPFLDGTVFGSDEPLHGARATTIELRKRRLDSDEKTIQYLREYAAHFRKKGWMDRLFNYLWDEPGPQHYEEMIARGNLVRRADAEIKNLVTAPLHREWAAVIDIWSPVINCIEPKPAHGSFCDVTVERTAYAPEIAKGKALWWYQSCGSHGCNVVGGDYFTGWPSYMIDAGGVANRIMQWMAWKYDVKGELYFNIDEAYAKKDDVWKDVHLFGGNGDGTLVFPGRPDTIGGKSHIPIESIRLKLIREGLEDYEYLILLARHSGSKAVAQHVDSLVRTAYDFDKNPEKLYAVREEMGNELSRIGSEN
jgi:hypothetical protein